MKLKMLVSEFAVLAEAPGGVRRLRQMVLGLALCGSLSNEFGPGDWERAKLGEIADCVLGKMLDKSKHTRGTKRPYLRNINVRWGTVSLDDLMEMFFEDDELERYGVRRGDVLVCEGGEPGRAAVWMDNREMLIQKAIHRVRPSTRVLPAWIVLNLRYDSWAGRLARFFTGATIQHFTGKALSSYEIPLPPVDEQKRILAKVDELMRMIDDLEAKQATRREALVRLRTAALDALTSSAGPDEFATSWKRLAENFEVVFDRSETAKVVRRAVLDLAVRGRLTDRSPSDETAELLFDRLHQERVSIRGAGTKTTAPEFAPFELPPTWAWARLDQLWRSVTDGDHQPPPKSEEGVAFLTIGNVSRGTIDFSSTRFVNKGYFAGLDELRVPSRGDLLYTVVGSFGIPVLVEVERPFCVQRHIAILKPLPSTNVRFMQYLMQSDFVYRQAVRAATGIAQPTVGLGVLRNFLVPVPPLAEQGRIVDKVQVLMKLCDDLEATLQRSEATASKLAEAVAAEMVA